MNESDLSDWEWNRLQPLMPKPSTGRPAHDHRRLLNGIFWILGTGAPWRELPWRYGPWPTVANRFYRWRQAGIWERIGTELKQLAQQRCQLDWNQHFIDSTAVHAHQHAAGAPRPSDQDECLGRSRGGLSTKVHLRTDGMGKPLVLALTAGHQHDAPSYP